MSTTKRPKLKAINLSPVQSVSLDRANALAPKSTADRWHIDAAYRQRSAFYSSKRWQEVRAAVLRANPLCALCTVEGRTTPALIVDHIVDLAEGGAETDYGNLRPLCRPCDSRIRRMKQLGQTPPATAPAVPPAFTIA